MRENGTQIRPFEIPELALPETALSRSPGISDGVFDLTQPERKSSKLRSSILNETMLQRSEVSDRGRTRYSQEFLHSNQAKRKRLCCCYQVLSRTGEEIRNQC